MVLNKKGQGLSLTVIIVAAIALIVLVVLVLVFTGKIGSFGEQLDKQSQSELIKMQVSYGKCQPSQSMETQFTQSYSAAESDVDKAQVKDDYRDLIGDCKAFSNDENLCDSASDCRWG